MSAAPQATPELPAGTAMDLPLEEAVSRILAAVPAAARESVPLADAHGRVLAERMHSTIDLPGFDNSSMDGYAVRAGDVAAAGRETPVRLRLMGTAAAGETYQGRLEAGGCVRVATGAPLPAGADAVVMQEDTRNEPGTPGEVAILDAPKPWENVRLRGEDIKYGEVVGDAGIVLKAGGMALLAATGVATVNVGRRPRVGLLATGSELAEPGRMVTPGKIYESNRLALAALVEHVGAAPKIFPLVADDFTATCQALDEALTESDIVVTTGGASVGELDFIKRAFVEAGGQLEFWRVAIRPGRPIIFGRRGQKLLFGLPGNPVSAFVSCLLFVRPALLRWQGAREVSLPAHPGVLAEAATNPGDRPHFLRVRVDAAGIVSGSGLQASHALSSLAVANGLLELPPRVVLPAGAAVRVIRLDT
jgi:molybdopterin molybdotransferase